MLVGVIGDYKSENETHTALDRSLAQADVDWEWVATDVVPSSDELARRYAGLWIAPGSPYRSMDGALAAVTTARERGIPLVATCGGFQHVLVEYARNVLGVVDAEHAETSPDAAELVVTSLSCSLTGQAQRVLISPASRAAGLYGAAETVEDYYCKYGLNPEYRSMIEGAGLRVTGVDEVGDVRIVELESHPFFVATLFCFQTRSRADAPHPLVSGFVDAARRTWPVH